MPASNNSKQVEISLEEQSPRWYFLIKGQLISVRADNRIQAFRRATILLGLT